MYSPTDRITQTLNQYLSFTPSSLSLGLWSGDLTLSDSALKPSILNHPEFYIKGSTIGKIKINIPWGRVFTGGDLGGKGIVEVMDVTILIGVKNLQASSKMNNSLEDEKNFDMKRKEKQELIMRAERFMSDYMKGNDLKGFDLNNANAAEAEHILNVAAMKEAAALKSRRKTWASRLTTFLTSSITRRVISSVKLHLSNIKVSLSLEQNGSAGEDGGGICMGVGIDDVIVLRSDDEVTKDLVSKYDGDLNFYDQHHQFHEFPDHDGGDKKEKKKPPPGPPPGHPPQPPSSTSSSSSFSSTTDDTKDTNTNIQHNHPLHDILKRVQITGFSIYIKSLPNTKKKSPLTSHSSLANITTSSSRSLIHSSSSSSSLTTQSRVVPLVRRVAGKKKQDFLTLIREMKEKEKAGTLDDFLEEHEEASNNESKAKAMEEDKKEAEVIDLKKFWPGFGMQEEDCFFLKGGGVDIKVSLDSSVLDGDDETSSENNDKKSGSADKSFRKPTRIKGAAESIPPKASVSVNFTPFSLLFSTSTFHLLHSFTSSLKKQRYGRPPNALHKFKRPKTYNAALSYKSDHLTRNWWVYAISCVIREIRTRKGLGHGRIAIIESMRREYVSIYCDFIRGTLPRIGGKSEVLKCIEDELEVEQILAFRGVARRKVRLAKKNVISPVKQNTASSLSNGNGNGSFQAPIIETRISSNSTNTYTNTSSRKVKNFVEERARSYSPVRSFLDGPFRGEEEKSDPVLPIFDEDDEFSDDFNDRSSEYGIVRDLGLDNGGSGDSEFDAIASDIKKILNPVIVVSDKDGKAVPTLSLTYGVFVGFQNIAIKFASSRLNSSSIDNDDVSVNDDDYLDPSDSSDSDDDSITSEGTCSSDDIFSSRHRYAKMRADLTLHGKPHAMVFSFNLKRVIVNLRQASASRMELQAQVGTFLVLGCEYTHLVSMGQKEAIQCAEPQGPVRRDSAESAPVISISITKCNAFPSVSSLSQTKRTLSSVCNFVKLVVTLDSKALLKFYSFVLDTGPSLPTKSTIPPTKYEKLNTLADTCRSCKDLGFVEKTLSNHRKVSLALSFSGFEMLIPVSPCSSSSVNNMAPPENNAEDKRVKYLRVAIGSASAKSGVLFNAAKGMDRFRNQMFSNSRKNSLSSPSPAIPPHPLPSPQFAPHLHDDFNSSRHDEKINLSIQQVPQHMFQHTHVMIGKVCVEFVDASGKSSHALSLLDDNIDLKALVSDCLVPGYERQPVHRIGLFISPIKLKISEARLQGLVGVQKFVGHLNACMPKIEFNMKNRDKIREARKENFDFTYESEVLNMGKKSEVPTPEPLEPRVKLLVGHILNQIHAEFHSVQIVISADESNITPPQREILADECISDYLSQCSCYSTMPRTENKAVAASRQLYVDRLCCLGLLLHQAEEILDMTKQSYVTNLELLQHIGNTVAKDDVLRSSASSSEFNGGKSKVPRSSFTRSPRLPTMPIVSELADNLSSLVNNNQRTKRGSKSLRNKLSDYGLEDTQSDFNDSTSETESSDSSTEETESGSSGGSYASSSSSNSSSASSANRLIEAAINLAAGEVLPIILAYINSHIFGHQRELLVLELIMPTFSYLQLVYDARITFASKLFEIRNGAGVYFMRIRPEDQNPSPFSNNLSDKPPLSTKLSHEISSSTTWSNDDDDDNKTTTSFSESGSSSQQRSKKRAKKNKLKRVGDNMTYASASANVESEASKQGRKEERFGMKFTQVEQDKDNGFSTGGESTSCLASDELATKASLSRRREVHQIVSIDHLAIVACPRALVSFLETTNTLSALVTPNPNSDPLQAPSSTAASDLPSLPTNLNAKVSFCSILLTSDELGPFSSIEAQALNFEQTGPTKSSVRSRIRAMSESMEIYNLTPEGQTYPKIISSATRKPGDTSVSFPFYIEVTSHHDFWKTPTRMHIKFTHVNVQVIYRWINEIMQFLSNEEMLLGLYFKKLFEGTELLDDEGNPPPPLLFSILIKDSALVLPRHTLNKDVAALTFDELYVYKSFEHSSFETPSKPPENVNISLGKGRDNHKKSPFSNARPASGMNHNATPMRKTGPAEPLPRASSEINEDEFLDANEDEMTFASAKQIGSDYSRDDNSSLDSDGDDDFFFGDRPVSAFDKNLVPRCCVQATGIRIFTAVGATLEDGDVVDLAQSLNGLPMNHIAEGNAVYRDPSIIDNNNHHHEWVEATANPIQIEVVIDYDPHKRIMVSDFLTLSDGTEAPSNPLALSVSQSQLYLLLSLWYANMQELPIMFPWNEKELKFYAMYPEIPVDWPEYGTEEWVNYLKACASELTMECLLRFREVILKCSFDQNYFKLKPDTMFMAEAPVSPSPPPSKSTKPSTETPLKLPPLPGPQLHLTDFLLQIVNNEEGLMKIGGGAASFELGDKRLPGHTLHKRAFRAAKVSAFEKDIVDLRNLQPSSKNNGDRGEKCCTADVNEKEKPTGKRKFDSWVDMYWGLDGGRHTLLEELPQPFNLSLFMTPDAWCHVNAGLDHVDGAVQDLAPVWMALNYFACYFKTGEYGHPYFTSETNRDAALASNSEKKDGATGVPVDSELPECINLDFRLWLNRIHLIIPENPMSLESPCLLVESDAGLFFRYKTIGHDFWLQEVCAKSLAVVLTKNYMTPRESRGIRGMSGTGRNASTIIEGLTLYYKQTSNFKTDHSDMVIRLPLTDEEFYDAGELSGIESSTITFKPLLVPAPTAVSPLIKPKRDLEQKNLCDIVASYDELKLLGSLFGGFLGPIAVLDEEEKEKLDLVAEKAKSNPYSILLNLEGIRLFLVDPVLGMHYPVFKVSLPSIIVSISQLKAADEIYQTLMDSILDHESNSRVSQSSTDNALQVGIDVNIWAEYFNNTLKCWEPLIEPYKCYALYETCPARGEGLIVTAQCPLHLNLSGALFDTVDDALKSFSVGIAAKNKEGKSPVSKDGKNLPAGRSSATTTFALQDEELQKNGRAVSASHEVLSSLPIDERVAFSLVNLTGQRIRFHQSTKYENNSTAKLKYLKHASRARLQFDATTTVVTNRNIMEVPFDVQQEPEGLDLAPKSHYEREGEAMVALNAGRTRSRSMSNVSNYKGTAKLNMKEMSSNIGRGSHGVNLQVSGFNWLPGIAADALGKRFEMMVPQSQTVLNKLLKNWRLSNACRLLTEVSPFNGGRKLTVRSVFQIINKTAHPILLAINPDACHKPILPVGGANAPMLSPGLNAAKGMDSKRGKTGKGPFDSTEGFDDPSEFQRLDPGGVFNVPFLLLEEALRMEGNHLGSMWIRPDAYAEDSAELFGSLMAPGGAVTNSETCAIKFSSRPVQLAKVVQETSSIYNDIAETRDENSLQKSGEGIQISCPVVHKKEGVSVAPFCYCLEVKRSKIVRMGENVDANTKYPVHDKFESAAPSASKLARKKNTNFMAEFEYSDSDDEDDENNFLRNLHRASEIERIESKKEKKKKRDHKGFYQHAPVAYTFIVHPPIVIENLLPEDGTFELMHATRKQVVWWGVLRAGESVPVHTVGLDAPLLLLINLGHCRTPLGEGALIHDGVTTEGKSDTTNSRQEGAMQREFGKVIENIGLGAKGIASETTVVDSVGQRLGLKIENELGGGGQRRVTVYCPYWIVNTTQHALRYRQEGKAQFVSGTVSDGKDGSRPVDGSEWNTKMTEEKRKKDRLVAKASKSTPEPKTTPISPNLKPPKSVRRSSNGSSSSINNTADLSSNSAAAVNLKMHKVSKSTKSLFKEKTKKNRITSGSKKGDNPSSTFTSSTIDKTIFAGKPGALSRNNQGDLMERELDIMMKKELPISQVVALSFMFNFYDQNVLSLGQQKLCVQHSDTSKGVSSDWSQGFSLDTVGMNQILGMHCKDGRVLELSLTISVAPGKLAQYTKFIRFSPRFVIVNRLERPIKLWQDSSLLHSNYSSNFGYSWSNQRGRLKNINPEALTPTDVLFGFSSDKDQTLESVKSRLNKSALLGQAGLFADDGDDREDERNNPFNEALQATSASKRFGNLITKLEVGSFAPFFLPDTRADRTLRIDIGAGYYPSSCFSSDITGEYFLKFAPQIDSTQLKHIATRASPYYEVTLPPQDTEFKSTWHGELGVWFETDWVHMSPKIKGCKPGKYSFNHTDMHVGDVLVSINGIPTDGKGMSFDRSMELLKEKLRELTHAVSSGAGLGNKTKSGSGSLRAIDGLDEYKVVLQFQTYEEMMRLVQTKALKRSKSGKGVSRNRSQPHLAKQGSNLISTLVTETLASVIEDDDDSNGEEEDEEASNNAMHTLNGPTTNASKQRQDQLNINVEVKSLGPSLFMYIQPYDDRAPPYRIVNNAIKNVVFVRQRNCDGHPWTRINPGESCAYIWEEPMKHRRLSLRTGSRVGLTKAVTEKDEPHFEAHKKRFRLYGAEDEYESCYGAIRTIKFDEIGFTDRLPRPGHEGIDETSLFCRVDADGATRVLLITAYEKHSEEKHTIGQYLETIRKEIEEVNDKRINVQQLFQELQSSGRSSIVAALRQDRGQGNVAHPLQNRSPTSHASRKRGGVHDDEDEREDSDGLSNPTTSITSTPNELTLQQVEEKLIDFDDMPENSCLTKTHQVFVEVIEAMGLRANDLGGLSDPYCEVYVKNRDNRRRLFKVGKRVRTYYVEKTLNPSWSNQSFVLDVPEEAVESTRGFSVRVRIKDYTLFGANDFLGQTDVQLSSLVNQEETIGWFPLSARTGKMFNQTTGDKITGSVRLRLRWIHSVPALVDYRFNLTEKRLEELELLKRLVEAQQVEITKRDDDGSVRRRLEKEAKSARLMDVSGKKRGKSKSSAFPRHMRRGSIVLMSDIEKDLGKFGKNIERGAGESVRKIMMVKGAVQRQFKRIGERGHAIANDAASDADVTDDERTSREFNNEPMRLSQDPLRYFAKITTTERLKMARSKTFLTKFMKRAAASRNSFDFLAFPNKSPKNSNSNSTSNSAAMSVSTMQPQMQTGTMQGASNIPPLTSFFTNSDSYDDSESPQPPPISTPPRTVYEDDEFSSPAHLHTPIAATGVTTFTSHLHDAISREGSPFNSRDNAVNVNVDFNSNVSGNRSVSGSVNVSPYISQNSTTSSYHSQQLQQHLQQQQQHNSNNGAGATSPYASLESIASANNDTHHSLRSDVGDAEISVSTTTMRMMAVIGNSNGNSNDEVIDREEGVNHVFGERPNFLQPSVNTAEESESYFSNASDVSDEDDGKQFYTLQHPNSNNPNDPSDFQTHHQQQQQQTHFHSEDVITFEALQGLKSLHLLIGDASEGFFHERHLSVFTGVGQLGHGHGYGLMKTKKGVYRKVAKYGVPNIKEFKVLTDAVVWLNFKGTKSMYDVSKSSSNSNTGGGVDGDGDDGDGDDGDGKPLELDSIDDAVDEILRQLNTKPGDDNDDNDSDDNDNTDNTTGERTSTSTLAPLRSTLKTIRQNLTFTQTQTQSHHPSRTELYLALTALRLPLNVPRFTRDIALTVALRLAFSRSAFNRAAQRSLQSVMNPGGFITIKPLTALNLSEMGKCNVYVRLKYGGVTLVSDKADSRVALSWEHGNMSNGSGSSNNMNMNANNNNTGGGGSGSGASNGYRGKKRLSVAQAITNAQATAQDPVHRPRFTYMSNGDEKEDENALQIYINPLKALGVLHIAVMGERDMQADVELGILQIPLGAAIECCREHMGDVHGRKFKFSKHYHGGHANGHGRGKNTRHQHGHRRASHHHTNTNTAGSDIDLDLMYVRWFPLMSSKDCTAVEGDDGSNLRPNDTEKMTDREFENFYAPCIKLAVMWTPDKDGDKDGGGIGTSKGFYDGKDKNHNRNHNHKSAQPPSKPSAQPPKSKSTAHTHTHTPPLSTLSPVGSDKDLTSTSSNNTNNFDTNTKKAIPSMSMSRKPENMKRYCQLQLGSISLSLIDSSLAKELLTLNICDIELRYANTHSIDKFGLVIGWLQLDHQLPPSPSASTLLFANTPVILAPTPVANPQPTLQVQVVKDNLKSKTSLASFEYITMQLQELDVKVEESTVFAVFKFYSDCLRRRSLRSSAAYARGGYGGVGIGSGSGSGSGGGLGVDGGFGFSQVNSFFGNAFTENLDGGVDLGLAGQVENTIDATANAANAAATKAKAKVKVNSSNSRSRSSIDMPKPHEDVGFMQQKVYIEELVLGSVRVNLSYIKSSSKSDVDGGENSSNSGNSSGGGNGSERHTHTHGNGVRQSLSKGNVGNLRKSINGNINGGVGAAGSGVSAGGGVGGGPSTSTSSSHTHTTPNMISQDFSWGIDDDDQTTKKSRNIAITIAAAIPQITSVPLRINGKRLTHLFQTSGEVLEVILGYFYEVGLYQVYKILGSFDFLGNPYQLVNTFGIGVKDFFYEPALAFYKSPSTVGIGLLRGTLSLVSHTTSGVFGFGGKLSTQVSKGVRYLSMDDQFRSRHARQATMYTQRTGKAPPRIRNVKDIALTLMTPVHDVAYGLYKGATGIVTDPYYGLRKSGVCGLIRGIGHGVVGVTAKPFVGIADAFAHTFEAISNVASNINFLEIQYESVKKRRLPYIFGLDERLCPYDYVNSRAMDLMVKERRQEAFKTGANPNNRSNNNEVLVNAEVLRLEAGRDVYILTGLHKLSVFEVRREGGSSGGVFASLLWATVLKPDVGNYGLDVRMENKGHNGVALHLFEGERRRNNSNNSNSNSNYLRNGGGGGGGGGNRGGGNTKNGDSNNSNAPMSPTGGSGWGAGNMWGRDSIIRGAFGGSRDKDHRDTHTSHSHSNAKHGRDRDRDRGERDESVEDAIYMGLSDDAAEFSHLGPRASIGGTGAHTTGGNNASVNYGRDSTMIGQGRSNHGNTPRSRSKSVNVNQKRNTLNGGGSHAHGHGHMNTSTLKNKSVTGEFSHRPQLVRSHNSICCLTEKYEDVIYENGLHTDEYALSGNGNGRLGAGRAGGGGIGAGISGCLKFGEWEFSAHSRNMDDQHHRDERSVDDICEILEDATWGKTIPPSSSSVSISSENSNSNGRESQKDLMYDPTLAATSDGGPSWLILAHARAMFVATRPGPLPKGVGRNDPVVAISAEKLRNGGLSIGEYNEIVNRHGVAMLLMSDEMEREEEELGFGNAGSGNGEGSGFDYSSPPPTTTTTTGSVSGSKKSQLLKESDKRENAKNLISKAASDKLEREKYEEDERVRVRKGKVNNGKMKKEEERKKKKEKEQDFMAALSSVPGAASSKSSSRGIGSGEGDNEEDKFHSSRSLVPPNQPVPSSFDDNDFAKISDADFRVISSPIPPAVQSFLPVKETLIVKQRPVLERFESALMIEPPLPSASPVIGGGGRRSSLEPVSARSHHSHSSSFINLSSPFNEPLSPLSPTYSSNTTATNDNVLIERLQNVEDMLNVVFKKSNMNANFNERSSSTVGGGGGGNGGSTSTSVSDDQKTIASLIKEIEKLKNRLENGHGGRSGGGGGSNVLSTSMSVNSDVTTTPKVSISPSLQLPYRSPSRSPSPFPSQFPVPSPAPPVIARRTNNVTSLSSSSVNNTSMRSLERRKLPLYKRIQSFLKCFTCCFKRSGNKNKGSAVEEGDGMDTSTSIYDMSPKLTEGDVRNVDLKDNRSKDFGVNSLGSKSGSASASGSRSGSTSGKTTMKANTPHVNSKKKKGMSKLIPPKSRPPAIMIMPRNIGNRNGNGNGREMFLEKTSTSSLSPPLIVKTETTSRGRVLEMIPSPVIKSETVPSVSSEIMKSEEKDEIQNSTSSIPVVSSSVSSLTITPRMPSVRSDDVGLRKIIENEVAGGVDLNGESRDDGDDDDDSGDMSLGDDDFDSDDDNDDDVDVDVGEERGRNSEDEDEDDAEWEREEREIERNERSLEGLGADDVEMNPRIFENVYDGEDVN